MKDRSDLLTKGATSTRRGFIKRASAAAAGLGAWQALSAERVAGANERVNVAIIGCGGRGLNGLLDLFNSSGHSGGNYRRFACFSSGNNRCFACLGSGGGGHGHLSGGLRGRFSYGHFSRGLGGGFGGHLGGGNIRNHNCLRSRRCFHRRRRCRFSGEIDADRGGNDQNDH